MSVAFQCRQAFRHPVGNLFDMAASVGNPTFQDIFSFKLREQYKYII